MTDFRFLAPVSNLFPDVAQFIAPVVSIHVVALRITLLS